MGCQGDPTELCGGPALLNLYNFTGTYPIGASVVTAADGWTSRGCYRFGSSFISLSERALTASKATRRPRARLSAVLMQGT